MITIINGLVGSKAYGLDRPGSDDDFMSVHVAPTLEFARWPGKPPEDSFRTTSDTVDTVSYEVGKFASMTANSNPSTLELLYLTEYEELHPWGQALVDIRSDLLSQKVQHSYHGYACRQFHLLKERGRFPKVPANDRRLVKHAVHMLRLIDQGVQLWTTGELTVRVADPAELRDTAESIIYDENGVRDAKTVLDWAAEQFKKPTDLPPEPDVAALTDIIADIRRLNL